jgi:hypothetical protein
MSILFLGLIGAEKVPDAPAGDVYTAKSVVLDIADNWGGPYNIEVRQVDFLYAEEKIVVTSGFTTYATSTVGSIYGPDKMFDTSLSKTGNRLDRQYLSADYQLNNQRVIIVFEAPITFDSLVINNGHNDGFKTNAGAKNVNIHISTDAITDTTYNAAIANSSKIFDGQFKQHIASDVEDPQILELLPLQPLPELPTYTAKSVVLDIATNWGRGTYVELRQMDFYYKGSLITLTQNDFVAYATSNAGSSFLPKYAFDTEGSRIGSRDTNNTWASDGATGNQRLIVVFNTPITFDKIIITNDHHIGTQTDSGCKDVVINISNNVVDNTTYNDIIPYSSKIFDGVFPQHIASDVEDPQTLELLPLQPLPELFTYTAKSVVFDFADGYCDVYLGVRSIEFYKEGTRLDITPSDFTAYATSRYNDSYFPQYTFDTTKSKIGVWGGNQWIGAAGAVSNLRLIIVFNTQQDFDSIVINNSHENGNNTITGMKNTAIHISTDAITDTTYNAAIANSSKIFDGVLAQHVPNNVVDDQTLTLIAPPANTSVGLSVSPVTSPVCSYTLPTIHPITKALTVSDVPSIAVTEPAEPAETLPTYTAKSVVLDIDNTWNNITQTGVGFRVIRFFKEGTLILPTYGIDDAIASTYADSAWAPWRSFIDPQTLRIGNAWNTCWKTNSVNNARYICKFATAIEFDEIRIVNFHTGGGGTDTGIKDVRIHITEDVYSDTTHNATITNSTKIFDGQFTQHPGGDIEAEETLVLLDPPPEIALTIPGTPNTAVLTTKPNVPTADLSTSVPGIPSTSVSTSKLTVHESALQMSIPGVPSIAVTEPAEPLHIYTAKSIILDITDNWGFSWLGLRTIEFFLNQVRLDFLSSSNKVVGVADPSHYDATGHPSFAFFTDLAKTNRLTNRQWYTVGSKTSQVRLIGSFSELIHFDEIKINNSHDGGYSVTSGVKNVKIYTTLEDYQDYTYEADIPGAIKIYDGQFRQHVAQDVEDAQTLTLLVPPPVMQIPILDKPTTDYTTQVNVPTVQTQQIPILDKPTTDYTTQVNVPTVQTQQIPILDKLTVAYTTEKI